MKAELKAELIRKLQTLEGITDDERAALLGLLRTNRTYGLVWEDKPEDIEETLREQLPVLREVKDKAIIAAENREGEIPPPVNSLIPNHLIIEGDNLVSLSALAYTHAGKIDVIYIDPPYNTGNKDFVYNDSFVDKEDAYRHSKWLSFMERRLRIAKKLLSDRGVIFISIDDNEQANLKLLCDSVFGEKNYRNTILVRRRVKSLNSQFASKGLYSLNVGFEYVFCYSKTSDFSMQALRQQKSNGLQAGKWQGFWSNADRPTMRYEILGFVPTSGQWRNSKEKADKWVENYKVYKALYSDKMSLDEYYAQTGISEFIKRDLSGKGKNGGVYHWVPPTDSSIRTSNWTDIEVTQIQKDFDDLEFSNPKSKALMKELVRLPNVPNPTILDFFAGSGTTLHAVMQLNAEDGGHRQCILCTNNENGICENVTYERNKRVIRGYTKPNGEKVEGLHDNNLRYYRTEFVGRSRTPRNMQRLVELSTDMLCIKEDLYAEQTEFGGMRIVPRVFRYFAEGERKMLIIYREEYIEDIVRLIAKVETTAPIRVYVFSPCEDPASELFEPVAEKVEPVALPAAIYNTYKRILPKRRDRRVDTEADNAEGGADTETDNELGGLFETQDEA